ncbi:Predicted arabinose efflux permease, MFS family [Azospirillaceae bacterium]
MSLPLIAAAILMVTMGARQSLGLFVAPLDETTGLGVTTISFAMAIGQFMWGAIQPFAGAAADRWGPGRVLAIGLLSASLGIALTPFMTTAWGLSLSLGILFSAGSGAASFPVLIGAVTPRLAPEKRGAATGVINAGGSFGQFVFAPTLQALISTLGWMNALWAPALVMLAALIPARLLRRAPDLDHTNAAQEEKNFNALPTRGGVWAAVLHALKDRSYLLLHAGFFTCGFHVAFLVTHMPGEVSLCGLPSRVAGWSLAIIGLFNIFGSLIAGVLISRRRCKDVLFWMYGSRAILIFAYLLAPKVEATYYLFAAGLGFTWLATVPPTATLVGKLFGLRRLSTLFGLTLLSHQIGGFLGAYLGGVAVWSFGDYKWMWCADITLAAIAAALNLPIRENLPIRKKTMESNNN